MLEQLTRSRYNYFVDRPDGIMGYNARTGTFALLASDIAAALRGDGSIKGIRDEEKLVEMGFLHSGNELDLVTTRFHAARQHESALSLTLTPTLACNFRCDYCYQNSYREDKVMSSEVQKAMVHYVAELVKSGRKQVSLFWYGGEPLLVKDLVLRLTTRLRSTIDAAGGILQSVSIITNGTLLDEATARDLADVGVAFAQVSIDSLYYVHGTKRGAINQDGTPSIILSNLLHAQQHLKVTIRVNVAPSNKDDLPGIINTLDQYDLSEDYYLARVHAIGQGAEPDHQEVTSEPTRFSLPIIPNNQDLLSRPEYARLEIAEWLMRPEGLQSMIEKLTPRESHYCAATDGSLHLVDPAGYISRCWMSAGKQSESIGNVRSPVEAASSDSVSERWLGYTPLAYPSCQTCKVLPLCIGAYIPRLPLGHSGRLILSQKRS